MKILDRQRLTATHIAMSLQKPNARPKLVKEYVCPNARGTAKLITNLLKMNKGQLVTAAKINWGGYTDKQVLVM